MPIIEVRQVTKRFRIPSVRRDTVREHVLDWFRPRSFDRLTVLDSIDISVEPGEALGIMGRNGSGKSTLLKIISGIYQPDEGSVRIGAPITPILELGVGWNPELDAIDNIMLLGTVLGFTLRELRPSIAEILAFAELERFSSLKLRHYSSGMAARLAYAVAFQSVRDILILDEIFAVGDEGFKQRCRARCQDLRARGHTVLLVSHNPSDITGFCQRALLLERGRVVEQGDPGAVASAYLELVRSAPAPGGESVP